MTIQQAISEIKREHKWYMIALTENEQAQLRVIASRIEKRTAKQSTIETFLNKFGYEITIDVRKSK